MLINNRFSKTSFQSTIQIVNPEEFAVAVQRISNNEVKFPWTINGSRLSIDVYTRGVYDCGVVGITNGKEAFLMHICPTEVANSNFTKIRDFILEKIRYMRNEYVQGFVLGGKADISCQSSPKSMEYADNYCEIFKHEGIPFTKLLGGKDWNDVAYFTEKDMWLIGNIQSAQLRNAYRDNPAAAAKSIFDKVDLCEFDEFSW